MHACMCVYLYLYICIRTYIYIHEMYLHVYINVYIYRCWRNQAQWSLPRLSPLRFIASARRRVRLVCVAMAVDVGVGVVVWVGGCVCVPLTAEFIWFSKEEGASRVCGYGCGLCGCCCVYVWVCVRPSHQWNLLSQQGGVCAWFVCVALWLWLWLCLWMGICGFGCVGLTLTKEEDASRVFVCFCDVALSVDGRRCVLVGVGVWMSLSPKRWVRLVCFRVIVAVDGWVGVFMCVSVCRSHEGGWCAFRVCGCVCVSQCEGGDVYVCVSLSSRSRVLLLGAVLCVYCIVCVLVFHFCMCVSVYTYIYLHMHIYINVCLCLCHNCTHTTMHENLHMYVLLRTTAFARRKAKYIWLVMYTYIFMYTYTNIYTNIYLCLYVYMCKYTCIYMFMHIYIYIQIDIHMHLYMCTGTWSRICICVHIYVNVCLCFENVVYTAAEICVYMHILYMYTHTHTQNSAIDPFSEKQSA